MFSKRNIGILISYILSFIILLMIFYISINKYDIEYIVEGPYDHLEKNNYDFSNVDSDSIYKEYIGNDGYSSIIGVTISQQDGDVNWYKVSGTDVDFAMISAGYRDKKTGLLIVDDYFENNVQKANLNNVPIGIYFTSNALNEIEAKEEANFVIDLIKDAEITYPIAYYSKGADDAYRCNLLTKENFTSNAEAFATVIKNNNYTPMIYLHDIWYEKHYDLNVISQYDIWYAQSEIYPSFEYEFDIWKYTETGYVDGVETPVAISMHLIKDGINPYMAKDN